MEQKRQMFHQHNVELNRFQRACDQIIQLNGKLDSLGRRYLAAKDNNNKCFRYALRSRILVVEGMLTAYTNYAKWKKIDIIKLRQLLADGRVRTATDIDTSDDETDFDQ